MATKGNASGVMNVAQLHGIGDFIGIGHRQHFDLIMVKPKPVLRSRNLSAQSGT